MAEAFAQGINYLDLKIRWAKKRLDEFNAMATAYTTHPHRVTKHDDVINQRYVIQVQVKAVNYRIALLLGDFAYALRSGLDQLAWQLSLLTTATPRRKTQFPIHDSNDATSEKTFVACLKHVPPDAIAVIRDLQPYKRGAAFRDDPLWQLGELCNLDKHRLFAGRSTDISMFLSPPGWRRFDFKDGAEFSWPLAVKAKVIFEPYIADLVFGEPIDSTGTPFEISRSEIAEIHRYVRHEDPATFCALLPERPNSRSLNPRPNVTFSPSGFLQ